MPNNYTRRTVVSSLAALAAASQTAGSVAGKEAEGQGHGIEQEGATLNRFMTTIIGAEITGMFITEDGRFFFNVQHPDANLDGEDEPGILGAVTGVDMNQLPRDFQSVQIPEGDDDDYSDDGDGVPEPYDQRVRTALGDYQRLATGGDETDDGEELGSVYTPEGDSLTGQINPDFNGYVPSSEEPDEGYLFTNWEHRPGAMTRVHLQQNGRNGTWRVLGMENLDFSAVEGTWVNCFGTVSPWGTPLTSEENYSIPDTPVWNNPDWQYKGGVERLARHLGHERNDDGIFADKFPNPYRYGYIVELKEPESEEPIPEKRFALGRSTHENAVVMPDEKTAYTTSDGTARGFYKFVADEKGDLSSGTLYAAKATQKDRSAAIPTRSASASSGSNSGTPATRKSRSGLPSTTTSPRRTTRTVRTRISPKGDGRVGRRGRRRRPRRLPPVSTGRNAERRNDGIPQDGGDQHPARCRSGRGLHVRRHVEHQPNDGRRRGRHPA